MAVRFSLHVARARSLAAAAAFFIGLPRTLIPAVQRSAQARPAKVPALWPATVASPTGRLYNWGVVPLARHLPRAASHLP